MSQISANQGLVRLGVIGLGNIGQQHIKHIQNQVTSVAITALCSRTPVSIQGTEEAKHFTCYKALIDSKLVDAVLIATPTFEHFEQGQYALSKGLHVLMEKPLTLSILDGEKLIECANQSQVFALMLNQRTDPLFITMKDKIPALGEIQRTHWTLTNWFRPDIYFNVSDWRGTWKGEGGGLLLNQCIHNIDVYQWICGLPKSITSFCGFGKHHNIEVEDEVTAVFHYENGATGIFAASTGESPGINRFDIVGSHGTLCYDGTTLLFHQNSVGSDEFCATTREMFGQPACETIDITPTRDANQHATIIQNFINCILNKEKLIAPAEEGLRSLAVANGILLSSWTKKSVTLPFDKQIYQSALEDRIAASSLREKSDIEAKVNMDDSYR